MRKKLLVSVFAALLALSGRVAPAQAEEVVIKLGTLAPQGSPWHKLLKQASQEWEQASGGTVKLKIFAGGTMGNEGDMVKKLRNKVLQAAALSTIGLHEITPEPQALDIPMLVRSYEERAALLGDKKVMSVLETALFNAENKPGEPVDPNKGYVVLTWSEIGFTRFFSTQARPTLAEMRQGKVFSWEGDRDSTAAWKAGGFSPVVLSSDAMISSISTGLIDTFIYPPTYVLALRAHEKTKYMHDLIWSSLTGATIVSKATWNKVPEALRPQLKAIFVKYGDQIAAEARKMEEESIATMKKQGLVEVPVKNPAEWEKAVTDVYNTIRGHVVPAETFDLVFQTIKKYRASHGK